MPNNRLSSVEYSEYIQASLPPLARLKTSDDLYSFNGKYYEILSQQELGKFIYDYILKEGRPNEWSTRMEREIFRALSYHPKVKIIDEFDNNPKYINVNNGIVDLSTPYPYSLLPHSNEKHFTSIVDVDYDPLQKDTPVFNSFLETVTFINGLYHCLKSQPHVSLCGLDKSTHP